MYYVGTERCQRGEDAIRVVTAKAGISATRTIETTLGMTPRRGALQVTGGPEKTDRGI